MTTTTSHVPEHVPESEGPDGGVAAARPARLIHTESTTEIPVHLLFREEPAAPPGEVKLRPAVVAHRPPPEKEDRDTRDIGVRARASAPGVDPDIVERPARVLPGIAGVLAGVCGAAGCAVTAW
ncbi:hypothetical protein G3I22_23115, partial [Actinospica acidiphila]|nr:hypothetical protein [Actinospica acidiphila]